MDVRRQIVFDFLKAEGFNPSEFTDESILCYAFGFAIGILFDEDDLEYYRAIMYTDGMDLATLDALNTEFKGIKFSTFLGKTSVSCDGFYATPEDFCRVAKRALKGVAVGAMELSTRKLAAERAKEDAEQKAVVEANADAE